MAHYAKVVDGIVTQVIVAEPDYFNTFVDSSPGEWIQTSYNTYGGVHYDPSKPYKTVPSQDQSKALRKNYAAIGYTYDKTLDAFIAPKPFNSWRLNEQSCLWEPPVSMPTSGPPVFWNESSQSWDVFTDAIV